MEVAAAVAGDGGSVVASSSSSSRSSRCRGCCVGEAAGSEVAVVVVAVLAVARKVLAIASLLRGRMETEKPGGAFHLPAVAGVVCSSYELLRIPLDEPGYDSNSRLCADRSRLASLSGLAAVQRQNSEQMAHVSLCCKRTCRIA